MITILDPRGEAGTPIDEYVLRADIRSAGLLVGLVSNGFPDATTLLTSVGEALAGVLDAPRVQIYARRDPSSQVAPEMADQVVAECHANVDLVQLGA